MPVTMDDSIANRILSVLPADKATAYRESLAANGEHTDAGWVFADVEAMAKAHDLFYPNGRPPGPVIVWPTPEPTSEQVQQTLVVQGWSAEAAKAEARGGCGCSPPVKES